MQRKIFTSLDLWRDLRASGIRPGPFNQEFMDLVHAEIEHLGAGEFEEGPSRGFGYNKVRESVTALLTI